jgi:putative membrane protein insertion efficiency factor
MRRALRALIRAYQLVVSPWLGKNCRFEPTCSQYACDAIELHGSLRGSLLAARRLCRCHPFHPGGHDPVPPPPGLTAA